MMADTLADTRSERITIRLTPAEKARWQEQARIAGQDLTAFVIARVRQPTVSQQPSAMADTIDRARIKADFQIIFNFLQAKSQEFETNEEELKPIKEVKERVKKL